ncbi:MAG: BspA family leucine-rich repeat surface protein, partial [Bacteroidales bacterium]|nr:BspA family leucine-rich repeat surface protein [Bacteroidales bacterium]
MLKTYFFLALLFTFFGNIYAQDAFITKWKIESNDLNLTIPVSTSYSYNYTIDWGDNSTNTSVTSDITHTYTQSGTYTIKITGNFPYIYFVNKTQLIDVVQWGTIKWESMEGSFYSCSNLPSFSATDNPDLSNVTNMRVMFIYAASFNGDLSNWDVSNVTDMSEMFSVTDSFNGDLSNWDVSSVNDMSFMFNEALSFNGDLSNWDVSNVTEMVQMFNLATSFNGDLSNWDVSKVIDMSDMFWGVTLSTNNYDALLKGWSDLTLQNGVSFDGGNSNYCNSETERQNIINNFGWTINDGGKDCTGLDKTYVPDDHFEQALIDLGYDDVLDDHVLTTNISGVTSLDIHGKQITDLTGIEEFTALTSLNCSDNNLTWLDIKNGANSILLSFDVTNNPSLQCIQVDDATAANAGEAPYTNWKKDAAATYSEDCSSFWDTYI